MPKTDEHLRIVSLGSILEENLRIPGYQRPYKWSMESAVTLFTDTFKAFTSKIPEYRIGSVILHNKNGEYDIVDGQQRLITLTILVYCLSQHLEKEDLNVYPTLLSTEFNSLSTESVVNNHLILKSIVDEIEITQLKDYKDYLLNQCTVVRIVTDSEQEAFQFFDSQNSRGKALAPHDLLKSYHLREMVDDDVSEKISIIERWEYTKQKELEDLFKEHLYPLVRWYKHQDGIGYSTKNIKTFKGIKPNSVYNFSVYNRAANLYIERFNREGMYELTSGRMINQFQLTQPIIAGKRFFEYSLHYLELKAKVEQHIESVLNIAEKCLLPEEGAGDRYIKCLFVNVVMFYVDKFNFDALTLSRLKLMYKWAYSLRIVMKSVYRESANRYALGKHDRINPSFNLFARISEMQEPEEMDVIVLDPIDETLINEYDINTDRYKQIIDEIGF